MPAFFLTLIAAGLASLGARDQMLVARLRASMGPHRGLLLVAWIVAAIAAGLAALAGDWIADMLPPAAKRMLAGFALIAAAVELALPRPTPAPSEPTRSLGAIALVLLIRAMGDGTRFLILAIAAATGAPVLAAIGGALGSGAAMTLAWAQGEALAKAGWIRPMRWAVAAVLGIAGLFMALSARGIV